MFNLKAQHSAKWNIEKPKLIHIKISFRSSKTKRKLDRLLDFKKDSRTDQSMQRVRNRRLCDYIRRAKKNLREQWKYFVS